MKGKKVLFGLSGSVAAYRTCSVVSALVKEGAEVRCVLTKSATEFITPLALSTVSRQQAYSDSFETPSFSKALHIALAEWAELVVLMPATANLLAKAAHGIADDLLSSILLSVTCPVLVVPAMNTQMWDHPATQRNIRILQGDKMEFVMPIHGELSCGTVGIGHIAEDHTILAAVKQRLI